MVSRSTLIALSAAAVTAVITATSMDLAADCPYYADSEIWTLELVTVTVDGETIDGWDDYLDLEFELRSTLSGVNYRITDPAADEETQGFFHGHGEEVPNHLAGYLMGGDQ
jgi:hypothetical protein